MAQLILKEDMCIQNRTTQNIKKNSMALDTYDEEYTDIFNNPQQPIFDNFNKSSSSQDQVLPFDKLDFLEEKPQYDFFSKEMYQDDQQQQQVQLRDFSPQKVYNQRKLSNININNNDSFGFYPEQEQQQEQNLNFLNRPNDIRDKYEFNLLQNNSQKSLDTNYDDETESGRLGINKKIKKNNTNKTKLKKSLSSKTTINQGDLNDQQLLKSYSCQQQDTQSLRNDYSDNTECHHPFDNNNMNCTDNNQKNNKSKNNKNNNGQPKQKRQYIKRQNKSKTIFKINDESQCNTKIKIECTLPAPSTIEAQKSNNNNDNILPNINSNTNIDGLDKNQIKKEENDNILVKKEEQIVEKIEEELDQSNNLTNFNSNQINNKNQKQSNNYIKNNNNIQQEKQNLNSNKNDNDNNENPNYYKTFLKGIMGNYKKNSNQEETQKIFPSTFDCQNKLKESFYKQFEKFYQKNTKFFNDVTHIPQPCYFFPDMLQQDTSYYQQLYWIENSFNTPDKATLAKIENELGQDYLTNFDLPLEEAQYRLNLNKNDIKQNLIQQQQKFMKQILLLRKQRKEKVNRYLQKRRKSRNSQPFINDAKKKMSDDRLRYKGRFVTKEQAQDYLGVSIQGMTFDQVQHLLNVKCYNQRKLNKGGSNTDFDFDDEDFDEEDIDEEEEEEEEEENDNSNSSKNVKQESQI